MIFDILLVVIGLVVGYIFKAKIHDSIVRAEAEAGRLSAQLEVIRAHAKEVLGRAEVDFKAEYQKLHDILKNIF